MHQATWIWADRPLAPHTHVLHASKARARMPGAVSSRSPSRLDAFPGLDPAVGAGWPPSFGVASGFTSTGCVVSRRAYLCREIQECWKLSPVGSKIADSKSAVCRDLGLNGFQLPPVTHGQDEKSVWVTALL